MQISTYIKHGDFISAHKSLYLSSCSLPRGIYVEQISEVPEDHVACWWCKQGDTGNAFKKVTASEGAHEQEISQSKECSQIDNQGVWPVGHMIFIVFFWDFQTIPDFLTQSLIVILHFPLFILSDKCYQTGKMKRCFSYQDPKCSRMWLLLL